MVSSPSSFDSPSEMPFPPISESDNTGYDFKTKEFMRLMYHSRDESPVSVDLFVILRILYFIKIFYISMPGTDDAFFILYH